MSSIYVTGAGIVSAIGVGKQETLTSLLEERSGIGPMKYLSSIHRDIPVGEVKLSNEEMMERLGIKESLSRTVLLGRLALREALEEASLTAEDIRDTHFISATTVGGMDRRELIHSEEKHADRDIALTAIHSCATSTEQIAEHCDFASLSTVSTACSSATNAIITGCNMLRCGLAERVVVGGSECLSMFHLNGFNSLMILDKEQCKPFDKNRRGLNLGEGAAFLVLETQQSVTMRGVKPLCIISGYGNACDAFHQTASSPDGEGAYLAMKEALEMAGMTPDDIQYINAHGTGTPNNDESETVAIRRVYENDNPNVKPHIPPISSTKSFTGHTTSASGAIEAVICILALQHQFLPVNLNWHEKMDGVDSHSLPFDKLRTSSAQGKLGSGQACLPTMDSIIPVLNSKPDGEIRNIQSNAFGFGGNDSSIIFSNVNDSVGVGDGDGVGQRHIYIQAAEQVSIQQPLTDITEYIPVRAARRMSRITKHALVTTLKVLKKTGIEHPDAIITGTNYGNLEYTEKFLDSLIDNGEEALSPTYFMQSTHNTVGSALAIHTKNHGYNTTYSHGSFSFDLSLLDAWMQMRLGKISTALVGGHEEMVESFIKLLSLVSTSNTEASVSMLLSTHVEKDTLCELAGIRVFNDNESENIDDMLAEAGTTRDEVSIIPVEKYKTIYGNNSVLSALAVYAAAHESRNVLLINHSGKQRSLILLKKI